MLEKFAQRSQTLQHLAIRIVSSIHPSIEHNLQKIWMLKRAMFHCELEQIPGGYFEFGVYEGTSLYAAVTIHQKLRSKIPRNFYGFDVFDLGIKYFDERDRHPFFLEGSFRSSYHRVCQRFQRFPNVHLIPGYFEETLAGKSPQALGIKDECAIAFLDCDLMNSARIALNFIKPLLQAGTVIVLDDYWAYRGNLKLGVYGAFHQFLEENPKFIVREFCRYGYGGTSFIVAQMPV